MSQEMQSMVKTIIEAQVIQALNDAPQAIEKLVKSALSKEVDANTGRSDGYSSNRTPYLDWLVGEEIRMATRTATQKVIQEMMPNIEAEVRKGLSSESVAAAVTKSLVGAAAQDWRINVKFEAVKD